LSRDLIAYLISEHNAFNQAREILTHQPEVLSSVRPPLAFQDHDRIYYKRNICSVRLVPAYVSVHILMDGWMRLKEAGRCLRPAAGDGRHVPHGWDLLVRDEHLYHVLHEIHTVIYTLYTRYTYMIYIYGHYI